MALNPEEMQLYAIAQKLIGAGKLPRHVARAVWAGSGNGSPCALCPDPVLPDQVEYEVEDRSGGTFIFHVRCHALWLLALTERDQHLGPAR